MADAGFFKGTSADQDRRFSDKELKLLKSMKFPPEFDKKVDLKKVNLNVIRPWIAKKVTELVGFEDEVVVEYAMGLLEDPNHTNPDPKKMQINLTGFLTSSTPSFMLSLWSLLLEAQEHPAGVPQTFVEEKKEEMRKAREGDARAIGERDRRARLDEIRDQERGERGDRGGRGRGRGRGRGGYEGGGRGRDNGWGGRGGGRPGRRTSRSPPPHRRRSPSPSSPFDARSSRSPPPSLRRSRSPRRPRSRTPAYRRSSPPPRRSQTLSPPPRRRRSLTPSPRRRRRSPSANSRSRSPPPARRRRRSPSYSRSPPRRHGRERNSRSPPPQRRKLSRSPSVASSPSRSPPRYARRRSPILRRRGSVSRSPSPVRRRSNRDDAGDGGKGKRPTRRSPSPSRMDVDKPRSTDESLPQNSKGELKIKGQAKRSKSDVLGNSGEGGEPDSADLEKREKELKERALRNKVVRTRKGSSGAGGSA